MKLNLSPFKYLAFVFVVLTIAIGGISHAQSKKELQKQRDEINEKIALTKKLIREAESNQKVTSGQLSLLTEQLKYREQLLRNINSDIHVIDKEISSKEGNINSLNQQLDYLKREYAEMVIQAYKNRSSYDKMMFIFASKDFNQAYKRLKFTQHYAQVRKRHVDEIESTKISINQNISALQVDKEQKKKLADSKAREKEEIDQNKKKQQQKLSELQKEEKKLRDQQKKQEADRRKLTAKIEEIIKKEIEEAQRKERERQEAEARKRAAEGGATPTPNNSSKTTSYTPAPEVLALNADFEKNKGSLPWPVSAGIITQRFGKHPHASIAGVEVNSNGVDFATERGTSVIAVFEGKVTSVFSIPGAGQNIIVTHGLYKTVYSGLGDVTVKVGDTVSRGQKIGTILSDDDEYVLHFEVWKVNAESGNAQNPELWLKKR